MIKRMIALALIVFSFAGPALAQTGQMYATANQEAKICKLVDGKIDFCSSVERGTTLAISFTSTEGVCSVRGPNIEDNGEIELVGICSQWDIVQLETT